MRLQGKRAVITGGGTGIGAGCAVALANEGCRVLISGRRDDKLQEVVHACSGETPILTHTCDVADRASCQSMLNAAREQLGQIDIVIHSAGLNIKSRLMSNTTPEEWDLLMNVNATGGYNIIGNVLPDMRERKDGLIVLISSIAGIRGSMLGGVAYSASKFALSGMGMTVGQEVKDEGVRITNLYPGEVNTPILDGRPVPVSEEHRAQILQPEDVAAAVLMIACLPPRAHIPEITITPTTYAFA